MTTKSDHDETKLANAYSRIDELLAINENLRKYSRPQLDELLIKTIEALENENIELRERIETLVETELEDARREARILNRVVETLQRDIRELEVKLMQALAS